MIDLPLFQDISAKFTYTIEIEEEIYQFYFDWNVRSENWYLTITHLESGLKLSNIKIIPNFPLLKQRKALFDIMEGDLFLIKLNDVSEMVDYDNIGVDYKLYYYTKDEFEDWLETYGLE